MNSILFSARNVEHTNESQIYFEEFRFFKIKTILFDEKAVSVNQILIPDFVVI